MRATIAAAVPSLAGSSAAARSTTDTMLSQRPLTMRKGPASTKARSSEVRGRSARGSPRVRPQARSLDGGDRGGFVVVGGVARDADSAEHTAFAVPHEHAARHRHQSAAYDPVDGRDEGWLLLRPLAEGAGAEPERERAVGFRVRDLVTGKRGPVLRSRRLEAATLVQDRHREGLQAATAGFGQRGPDDRLGGIE